MRLSEAKIDGHERLTKRSDSLMNYVLTGVLIHLSTHHQPIRIPEVVHLPSTTSLSGGGQDHETVSDPCSRSSTSWALIPARRHHVFNLYFRLNFRVCACVTSVDRNQKRNIATVKELCLHASCVLDSMDGERMGGKGG